MHQSRGRIMRAPSSCTNPATSPKSKTCRCRPSWSHGRHHQAGGHLRVWKPRSGSLSRRPAVHEQRMGHEYVRNSHRVGRPSRPSSPAISSSGSFCISCGECAMLPRRIPSLRDAASQGDAFVGTRRRHKPSTHAWPSQMARVGDAQGPHARAAPHSWRLPTPAGSPPTRPGQPQEDHRRRG